MTYCVTTSQQILQPPLPNPTMSDLQVLRSTLTICSRRDTHNSYAPLALPMHTWPASQWCVAGHLLGTGISQGPTHTHRHHNRTWQVCWKCRPRTLGPLYRWPMVGHNRLQVPSAVWSLLVWKGEWWRARGLANVDGLLHGSHNNSSHLNFTSCLTPWSKNLWLTSLKSSTPEPTISSFFQLVTGFNLLDYGLVWVRHAIVY